MKGVQQICFMRHVRSIACGAFVFLAIGAALAQGQARAGLKTGDRVAFFGDSITAQDLYTTFVAHHFLFRRPELKLEFKNAGVGGDQLEQALARVDRDIVPFKPTVITCCFGMNDAGYVAPDDPKAAQNLEKYKANYVKLLDVLKEKLPEARVILFTTTVVDPGAKAPFNLNLKKYNELLGRFSDAVRQIGKERGLQVVDLYTPMLKWVEESSAMQPPHSFIPDSVHPNAAGQFLMAEHILKELGER